LILKLILDLIHAIPEQSDFPYWQITPKIHAALIFLDGSGDIGCSPCRGVFQVLEAVLYAVCQSPDPLTDASEALAGTAAAVSLRSLGSLGEKKGSLSGSGHEAQVYSPEEMYAWGSFH
jgi:hypothetical protein